MRNELDHLLKHFYLLIFVIKSLLCLLFYLYIFVIKLSLCVNFFHLYIGVYIITLLTGDAKRGLGWHFLWWWIEIFFVINPNILTCTTYSALYHSVNMTASLLQSLVIKSVYKMCWFFLCVLVHWFPFVGPYLYNELFTVQWVLWTYCSY